MTDLRELYQQVILEHSRSPRNFRKLEGTDRKAEGSNPLCGDKLTVYVDLDGDVVRDIGFEGTGCAISRASASLMTGSVKGKTLEEAREIFRAFRAMVTRGMGSEVDEDAVGKLSVFSGVRDYPVRVKCATLAWHTLNAALEGTDDLVSTE